PRPAFHQAREPIVLIKGARAARLLDDTGTLNCRLAGQLLTKADDTAVSATEPPGFAALKNTFPATFPSGLADGVLAEFATLDQHCAPTTAVFADNATPVGWTSDDPRVRAVRWAVTTWKQPWTPLHLVWEGEYFAIPYNDYKDQTRRNWVITDDGYVWRGKGDADDGKAVPRRISGQIALTAHAVHNIAERLARIDDEAPGQPAPFRSAVQDLLSYFTDPTAKGGDLISQALDGFTEQLTGRRSLVRPRPDADMAELLDGHHTYAPRDLQAVTKLPQNPGIDENWVEAPYYVPFRAGQFRLTRLFLVDRFGRGHQIVHTEDAPDQRPDPARAATVIPDSKDPNHSAAADALVHVERQDLWKPHLFHLRPRLPQPARLGFDVVSNLDDTSPAPNSSSGDQISGWIVPNYFDQALLCMAPDGLLLGELRPKNDTELQFERFHDDAPVLGHPSSAYPHLADFVNGLNSRNDRVKSLADMLAAVERARLTIAPYRPSSAHPTLHMLGRPLALLRARLELEPDAEPVVPIRPSLLGADPPTAEYQKYSWPILLGSTASFSDGLVGYFDQSDYATLYTVSPPDQLESTYVTGRGDGAHLALALGESRLVTLLTDPWGGVQATMFILPTGYLALDPDSVARALARMDAIFHLGPVLGSPRTVTVKTADLTEAKVNAFALPLPVVEAGTWSWQHPDGTRTDVAATDAAAHITPEFGARLRTGLLRLANGLSRRD
ncbi:hypothetical protein, partial [Actinomadura sp. KC06]|uniref:hypothetical protein n=1 Tax=Actinomadura sp. KC06 TaxID=2530369 RepID=UPI0014050746